MTILLNCLTLQTWGCMQHTIWKWSLVCASSCTVPRNCLAVPSGPGLKSCSGSCSNLTVQVIKSKQPEILPWLMTMDAASEATLIINNISPFCFCGKHQQPFRDTAHCIISSLFSLYLVYSRKRPSQWKVVIWIGGIVGKETINKGSRTEMWVKDVTFQFSPGLPWKRLFLGLSL